MRIYILILVTLTPKLKDLYQHITPQYAVDWKVIGTLLGLPSGTLDIIEHDNHYKARECCNAMWVRWLQVAPLPLGGSCLLSLSHLQYPVVKLLIKVTSCIQ